MCAGWAQEFGAPHEVSMQLSGGVGRELTADCKSVGLAYEGSNPSPATSL